MNSLRLIEDDAFDFEFLSRLAERESWRKEVHRPIYHIHKWWATRLGSVFRGILLGCLLPVDKHISDAFYASHNFSHVSLFDPFMGSGTTVGEAHKLGLVALGRDINPVAAESVRVALGSIDYKTLLDEFQKLSESVGEKLRYLYRSVDTDGRPCDVLYYFWVMQVDCPFCTSPVDLFPSWIIARNAYPNRKPKVQILCPSCGDIFPGIHGEEMTTYHSCHLEFSPERGTAKGSKASCRKCNGVFSILDAVAKENERPKFRLYGKLVLTEKGGKEYISATEADVAAYKACSQKLEQEIQEGSVILPNLRLEHGYNTKQAMSYGFKTMPKSQATEPIQLDIIIVCRKIGSSEIYCRDSPAIAVEKAKKKLLRLQSSGFSLSQNDRKVVVYGQLLTSVISVQDIELLPTLVEQGISVTTDKIFRQDSIWTH